MRWRLDQDEHGGSVWRCNRQQPLARFHACVERDLKPEHVEKETKASLLIPDVDVDRVHAQKRSARALLLGWMSHRRDCKRRESGEGSYPSTFDRAEPLAIAKIMISAPVRALVTRTGV